MAPVGRRLIVCSSSTASQALAALGAEAPRQLLPVRRQGGRTEDRFLEQGLGLWRQCVLYASGKTQSIPCEGGSFGRSVREFSSPGSAQQCRVLECFGEDAGGHVQQVVRTPAGDLGSVLRRQGQSARALACGHRRTDR